VSTAPTFWIVARASGITAYVLLTAVVLAGLLLKARPFGRRLKASSVTDVHRFLSLLALGAVAIHGITLVLDRVVPLPVQALLVPGIAEYRPVWTGAGVIAAELTALLIVSFSLRRWVGTKTWRRLHYASYAAFTAATVHGVMAGTDTPHPAIRTLYPAAVSWPRACRRGRPP
jgi:DMSO/TMAO reductase YedYZ heme-binding membrane subunit